MSALLSPKVWIAIALAAALAFSHFFVYRAGKAEVRKDFDAYKIDQQEQRILADRARAHRTEARQIAVNKEATDGQVKIAALETELAASRDAGERMRIAIRAATSRARTVPGTPGAGPGEPSADPIGMFALLLERADAREERISLYADRLRIAGSVCERGWDAGLQSQQ